MQEPSSVLGRLSPYPRNRKSRAFFSAPSVFRILWLEKPSRPCQADELGALPYSVSLSDLSIVRSMLGDSWLVISTTTLGSLFLDPFVPYLCLGMPCPWA